MVDWFLVDGWMDAVSLYSGFKAIPLLWCSYFIMEKVMHYEASTSTFSSEESGENFEHNVWNSMLCALCHFEIGKIMETFLEDVSLGRCALTCHFALDFLCERT